MKQNQILRPGKATFLFSWLTIAFFSFLLVSCNNEAKKPDEGNTSDTTRKEEKKKPSANAITAFKKFRILKTGINLQNRKLSFVPVFDDLSDPSSMSLKYFQLNQLSEVVAYADADENSDGNAVPFDTKGIILSNNELLLEDYDWPNIDYLVLEPTRDATYPNNLGYNIRAFRFSGSELPDTEVVLTPQARSAKPSPPAPPALYKK